MRFIRTRDWEDGVYESQLDRCPDCTEGNNANPEKEHQTIGDYLDTTPTLYELGDLSPDAEHDALTADRARIEAERRESTRRYRLAWLAGQGITVNRKGRREMGEADEEEEEDDNTLRGVRND